MTTLTVEGAVPAWSIGDRLRKAREHAGLSQSELEAVAGISRRSIVTYESDARRPSRPQLIAWALATGVSLAWLETGDPHPAGPGGGRGVRHQGLEPRTRWFGAAGDVVALRPAC